MTELSSTVCVSCRQRKTKCDRKLPKCSFCNKNGYSCKYVENQRKRGLRAGYVSELEKRLELVEQDIRILKAGQANESQMTDQTNDSERVYSHDFSTEEEIQSFDREIPSPNQAKTSIGSSFPPAIPYVLPPEGTITPSLLSELAGVWFSRYHNWFPILHSPSIFDALGSLPSPGTPDLGPLGIVIKAIAAVTLASSQTMPGLSNEHRASLLTHWRREVIMDAIPNSNINSLKGLLVLTVLYHGEGNIPEFWNLLALCKSISTQLGLRDLVSSESGACSEKPPRMISMPITIVDREEHVRAFWGTEVLDLSSTIGAAWNLSASVQRPASSLPISDDLFLLPESLIQLFSFEDFEIPSKFNNYVRLVTSELYKVHALWQEPFENTSAAFIRYEGKCRAISEQLLLWREKSGVVTSPGACYYISLDEATVFDPTIVLINATLNTAIIILWTRLAISTNGPPNTQPQRDHALQTCVSACKDMASFMAAVRDEDLMFMSPQLILCLFVAARFLLVHGQRSGTNLAPQYEMLLKAMRTCGQQWPYAARLHIVLQKAMCEYQWPLEIASLPKQFYDLEYSAVDIDEAMRVWVINQ